MATHPKSVETPKRRDKRGDVFIGSLPNDFLRIDCGQNGQQQEGEQQRIDLDREMALGLMHQNFRQSLAHQGVAQYRGRIIINVIEASLAKNYGLTKMDPYVRLRLGNFLFDTNPSPNGSTHPKWNRAFNCLLPIGVDTLYLEIYNECMLRADDKIAWGMLLLTDNILTEAPSEVIVPLTGKQGEFKEGNIFLQISFTPVAQLMQASFQGPVAIATTQLDGSLVINRPCSAQSTLPQPQPPKTVVISDEDVKQVQEIFPNVEIEVIKTIMENERGNKERTISNLIQLSNDT